LSHIAGPRNDVKSVINATGPLKTNAHLLRYDSVHGRFPDPVTDGKLDLGRG
jgi:glyceraldehyde 3-phosphate dehydrogenase